MVFGLIEGIPYMAGGAMITSAIGLNHYFEKRAFDSKQNMIIPNSKWKINFICGMVFMATIAATFFGFQQNEKQFMRPFESESIFFKGTGLVQFMLSGLLLGLGVGLSRGSLTKYALYGIPRFNPQVFLTLGTALIFGFSTATVRRGLPLLEGFNLSKKFNEHLDFKLSFFVPLVILAFNLFRERKENTAVKDILRSFSIGSFLAMGMLLAGLGRRHHVLALLSLKDFSLIYVIIGAFIADLIWSKSNLSAKGEAENIPGRAFNLRNLIGAALFGMGLGISGLTPGSGLLVSPIYLPQILLFFLPFVAGGQMLINFGDRFFEGGSKQPLKGQ